jgi:hypothetical protein
MGKTTHFLLLAFILTALAQAGMNFILFISDKIG